jgi:hypothetical protein
LPPNRVRHDEFEEPAFFGGLQLFEQPAHVSGGFEQPDASVHVLFVRNAVTLDFS